MLALAALQVLRLLDELRTDETADLASILLRPQPILGIGGTVAAAVAVRRGSRFGRALAAAVLAVLVGVAPILLALPFALLALGWVDARLAAAATLFWLWRLATADLGEVVTALGDASLTMQVVRWLAMLAGLAVAAHVTRASIRRAAAL